MNTDQAITKILNIQVNHEDAVRAIGEYATKLAEAAAAQELLNKKLSEGKITSDEYTRETKSIEQTSDSMKKVKDDMEEVVRESVESGKKQVGSLDNLRNNLKQLQEQYGKLSEEERKGAVGTELQRKMRLAEQEITRMSGSLGELGAQMKKSVMDESSKVGSVNRLRAELKALQSQYNALSKEERDEASVGGAIALQMQQKKKELDAVRASMQNMSREAQLVNRVEAAQKGSIEEMRATLQLLNKEYINMSKAEREAADGKAMRKHILSLSNEVKDLEGQIGLFQRRVGSYEDAIKNALGMNNAFGNSLLDLVKGGDGAKDFLVKAKDSVGAFGKALMGLMTNPVFLGIAGLVGVGFAFKWFYDYNKGIAEATRLTKEFLGLKGDNLVTMRSEIQATADVYNKSYKEVLQGVDAIVAQYADMGMTAQQAMQIINDGFEAGADENGDMLDKIQQYAPTFHDAGIAADEMMAIFQQTRSGIFSDKGLDIISMGSKRIREMGTATESALAGIGMSAEQVKKDLESGSKSTFDIIQEISTQLKKLPNDSQAVGDVLKDVFGRQGAQAGLQLIEQLDTMSTSLAEVKGQVDGSRHALEEQREAQAELNTVTAALFDMSGKGFEEMTIRAKTFLIQGLVSLIKGVIRLINYCIDLYNNFALVRGIINAIVVGVRTQMAVIKLAANVVIDVLKFIGRQVRDLGSRLMGLGDMLLGALTFDTDLIKQGWGKITANFVSFSKELIGDVNKFGREFGDAWVEGFNNTFNSKPIEHIKVPVSFEATNTPVTANEEEVTGNGGTGNGGTGNGGKGDKSGSSTDKTDKDREKQEQAEARHQEEMLKIRMEAEKNMLNLIESALARQRMAINVEYDKQIAELRLRLDTEKNLTIQQRTEINNSILALEKARADKLKAFDEQRVKEQVEQQKKVLDEQVKQAQKGSEERRDAQLEQTRIEYEEQRKVISEKMTEQANFVFSISAEYDEMVRRHREELAAATAQSLSEQEMAALQKKHEDEEVEVMRRLDTEQSIYDSYVTQREQNVAAQNEKEQQIQDEYDSAQAEKIRLQYENQINQMKLNDTITVDDQRKMLELKQQMADEELRIIVERGIKAGQTQEQYDAEIIAAQQKSAEQKKAITDYENDVEKTRFDAAKQVGDGLIKVMNAVGNDSKEMAMMSKVVALAQIAISTGEAIAKMVSAESGKGIIGIATMAGGIATILANVASAIATVKSAKFAKGGVAGIVDGKYEDDQDRLTVRVNKGEMILNDEQQQRVYRKLTGKGGAFTRNAQEELFGIAEGTVATPTGGAASDNVSRPSSVHASVTDVDLSPYAFSRNADLFSPLMAAFHQIGEMPPFDVVRYDDGRSLQNDMADRIVDGVESMPAPVVSVEDINNGQRRVDVIENIDTI